MTGKSASAWSTTLRRALTLSILLLSIVATGASAVSSEVNSEQQLQRLRQEIQSLRDELNNVQTRKASAEDQLRLTEISIGKINALLRSLDRRIERKDQELSQLTQRRTKANDNVQQHKDVLARQVRSDYLLGKQPYLKLLLNQQEPQKLTRTVAYFNYFHRARLQRIEQLDRELEHLQQLEQEIAVTHSQLENDKREKLAEKSLLEDHHRQRASLLASLNTRWNQTDARLKQLLEDEQRLAALVQQLQSEAILEPVPKRPFEDLRGQLNWPTPGPITVRFGSKRNIGELTWQGVMIAAAAGAEVRAVSHGRVAFADWFRGFGLLIILDHGNGYMSLYGHNESLFKEHGDWVEANEVISRVGPGGGKSESGLYFEIRHDGKPINPIRWCKK